MAPQPGEHFALPEAFVPSHVVHPLSRFPKPPVDDLSPGSGNFDRLLTARQHNYPYPGQFDPRQMGAYPTYGQMPHGAYMNPPSQSPSPGFPTPYTTGQFNPPAPQPMSRNPSQVSERPSSSTGQIQAPGIVQGTSQPSVSQPKAAPVVSSSPFQKPKGSKITIKNVQGETVNFNTLKAPASPAPAIQPSKTPPAVVSTPTPPSKPATPSHSRSESAAALKTAEQLRNEFKEQVRKSTEVPAEAKKEGKESASEPAAEPVAVTSVEEPVKAEESVKVEKQPAEPAKAAEHVEIKAETESKPDAPASAPEQEQKPEAADEEDEVERAIREMEEADAKREAEAAAYSVKKKVQQEEDKKRAEEQRVIDAAENDRKLKEAEREMERLEEERSRKRQEKAVNDKAEPIENDKVESTEKPSEKKTEDLVISEKDSTPSTPDVAAIKLSDIKTSGSAEGSSSGSPAEPPAGKPGTEKQRTKPSALNLTPLNTKAIEPPQPSAALQSLKTARFIQLTDKIDYPHGINSPNPALNSAVTRKGNFKYDPGFLLQFKNVYTEKPSLDFDQQLKTLIGDGESGSRSAVRTPAGAGSSSRQNSRSAAPGFPAMGSFGAKPLRAGGEQQFGMPGGSMSRPGVPPMASFGRGFPGPSQMSRTPSSSNMGNMPNSPRQGSRSTRGRQQAGQLQCQSRGSGC